MGGQDDCGDPSLGCFAAPLVEVHRLTPVVFTIPEVSSKLDRTYWSTVSSQWRVLDFLELTSRLASGRYILS